MSNRIGTQALHELVQAFEDGRLDDKHLVRLARNPHLASDLVVGERELWRVEEPRILDLVHTLDLGRAAWSAKGQDGWVVRTNDVKEWSCKFVPVRLQLSPSGNIVFWLCGPPGKERFMMNGSSFVHGVSRGVPGPMDEKEYFCDAALLGEHEYALITQDRMAYWRGKQSGPFNQYPQSIAVVAGQVIWTAGFALYHEGTKIADQIVDTAIEFKRDVLDRCVVSPDGKHFLYQARDGKTPLFLDGKEWHKAEARADLYGFLVDGSPFAIGRQGQDLFVGDYSRGLDLGPCCVTGFAGSTISNIVAVVIFETEKRSRVLHLEKNARGWIQPQEIRVHDEVIELIICGTDDFAYIARDGKTWAIYRIVFGSESERVGPTYRDQPSKLIASPDGKHLAWIVTQTRHHAPTQRYAVLSGDAGSLHEYVPRHCFVGNEYRYLARDEHTHRALAVTLVG